MVKTEVRNGKIYTEIKSEGKCNILEEVGNAVAELLAEFQAGLVRQGVSREKADAAFQEMIGIIMSQNTQRVDAKLSSSAGENEEFEALLFSMEKQFGRPLTSIEVETFNYFYRTLHMSLGLIEYMVKWCLKGGNTSMRYMRSIADVWHEHGIKTVDDAKSKIS